MRIGDVYAIINVKTHTRARTHTTHIHHPSTTSTHPNTTPPIRESNHKITMSGQWSQSTKEQECVGRRGWRRRGWRRPCQRQWKQWLLQRRSLWYWRRCQWWGWYGGLGGDGGHGDGGSRMSHGDGGVEYRDMGGDAGGGEGGVIGGSVGGAGSCGEPTSAAGGA